MCKRSDAGLYHMYIECKAAKTLQKEFNKDKPEMKWDTEEVMDMQHGRELTEWYGMYKEHIWLNWIEKQSEKDIIQRYRIDRFNDLIIDK